MGILRLIVAAKVTPEAHLLYEQQVVSVGV